MGEKVGWINRRGLKIKQRIKRREERGPVDHGERDSLNVKERGENTGFS